MASGASGDRRIGSTRRSMTVLGKIPAPAVPKPINLPSQKLESKGLEPNVEIVPRGTFTWGSRTGPTANKLPAPNIASSPPSSGAWADAAKRKIPTVSGSDAGIQPPSPGSSIRPSSAPTTGRAWDTVARSQSHEESIVFDANRLESSILGSQRSIDALPQKNDTGYLDRPISADGALSDKDRNSTPLHTGLISHGRAVSGPDVAVFPHSGDPQDRYIQQVIPSARVHDPRVGIGIYPRPPHHDVFYPPGVSHYNNVKDRDMVVVTMVGNTGYYGNYAPQVGHPEYYMQPQVYGSYPPHAHHSEQFNRQSHANRGVWSHNLDMGYSRDGDISSCAVEGFIETENDVRKQGDGLFGSGSGSVLRTEQNHRISKVPGRDKFHNGESGDSGSHTTTAHGGIPSLISSAERKIILLTKTSRAEEQNNMEMSNNLETGSSGTERNVEKQKNEVRIKSNETTNVMLDDKAHKVVERVEGKRKDGLINNEKRMMDEQAGASVTVVNNMVEFKVGAGFLKPSSSADSKYDVEWESTKDMSAPLLEDIREILEPKLVNHRTMSESDSGDTEKSTNPQKISITRGTATLVAEDHESLNKETPKTTTTADPALKDEHKVRSRLHNQKTGKEWRPKSPATDSQSSHCHTSLKLNEQAPSAGIAELQQAQLSGNFSVRSDKEKPDTVSTETGYHTGRKHRKEFPATGTNAASNPASNPDACAEDSKSVSADSLSLKDDSKSKMKQGGLKGEREWRPKSPAVEPLSTVPSSKIESAHVSDVESMNSEKKKIGEQETCDVYDYEGQRAKLKENATQRAMQRRREEEERAKEQKAKALAKLKELERRTAAHNSTVENSEHDTTIVDDNVVNDDGANDSAKVRHKRKPKSRHTAKDSSSHEVNAPEGITDKNLDSTHPFPSSKIGAKLKMEKTESLDTSTVSFTALGKSIDESDKNAKRLQLSASTQKNQVQFEQVFDLQEQSPREKTPLKNKKNESAKAGRARQERRYSTEENISKGSYRETVKRGSTQSFAENEDDKELALSVHGEVHARAESIRPASAPQYTREGGQYRQKHMVESDANIPDRHIGTPGGPDGEVVDQHARQERTGNNKVMPSPNELLISSEAKQAKGFDARYSSEKSGRLHVSWKQKNSSKDNPAEGEHATGNNSKHTENHSDGNSDSRKHKARNGRKQSSKSNQQVSVLPETVESYPMEENKQEVPVPIPTSSNLEEMKGNEISKSGRPQNSWRQKNNNGHPSSIISSFGETATDLEDPRGQYDEFPQENGNDFPPSSELINSNVRNSLKQSHKGGSAAPMWQKNRAMRSNVTGQAKSQHAIEDGFMGQQGRHISSKQMSDGKHLQENDSHVTPTQRKNSPQWHAEPAIYSEVNEQGHRQPGVASKHHQETDNQFHPNQRRNAPQRLSEPTTFSEVHIQGHKQSGMSSINRNKTKFESHKSHRQYHPASQVFKPSDEQVEYKAERTNHPDNRHEQVVSRAERTSRSENRHGQGRDKASKQAQPSACSTSAEFERMESGPVIKTEISY